MKLRLNKSRSQAVKVNRKENLIDKDTSTYKIKTLSDILSIDKDKFLKDDYFLDTYKKEDRNFMKKIRENDNIHNCKIFKFLN